MYLRCLATNGDDTSWMGGTQSKQNNFIDHESFDVGDVVLFTGASAAAECVRYAYVSLSAGSRRGCRAEKGGKSLYNVRYCKWISYSFAAFVVRPPLCTDVRNIQFSVIYGCER